MSKKQLDTQGIANELAGASVFFRADPQPAPRTNPGKTPETQQSAGEPSRKPEGAPVHSREGAPGRQKIKRGFQVYRDQVLALSELQFETYRRTGKKPHIGEMVRDALDDFIARKKRELDRR